VFSIYNKHTRNTIFRLCETLWRGKSLEKLVDGFGGFKVSRRYSKLNQAGPQLTPHKTRSTTLGLLGPLGYAGLYSVGSKLFDFEPVTVTNTLNEGYNKSRST
jgi:hypothetical protein